MQCTLPEATDHKMTHHVETMVSETLERMARHYVRKTLYFSNKLMENLKRIYEYPLTIVEVPMGYGKTTAVREYLNNNDANVLWQRVYDSSITVENAVYNPFSEEIKDLLLSLCLFDSFTTKQAVHMGENNNADILLNEITGRNGFVNYDANTKTYQMHNIFTGFLKEIFDKKDNDYKQNLYQKAGHWCMRNGEYITAMQHFYAAGDFDNLLQAMQGSTLDPDSVNRLMGNLNYYGVSQNITILWVCLNTTKRLASF